MQYTKYNTTTYYIQKGAFINGVLDSENIGERSEHVRLHNKQADMGQLLVGHSFSNLSFPSDEQLELRSSGMQYTKYNTTTYYIQKGAFINGVLDSENIGERSEHVRLHNKQAHIRDQQRDVWIKVFIKRK